MQVIFGPSLPLGASLVQPYPAPRFFFFFPYSHPLFLPPLGFVTSTACGIVFRDRIPTAP